MVCSVKPFQILWFVIMFLTKKITINWFNLPFFKHKDGYQGELYHVISPMKSHIFSYLFPKKLQFWLPIPPFPQEPKVEKAAAVIDPEAEAPDRLNVPLVDHRIWTIWRNR